MSPRPPTTRRNKIKEGEIEVYCRGPLSCEVVAAFDKIAAENKRSRNAQFLWLVEQYVRNRKLDIEDW